MAGAKAGAGWGAGGPGVQSSQLLMMLVSPPHHPMFAILLLDPVENGSSLGQLTGGIRILSTTPQANGVMLLNEPCFPLHLG